MAGRPGPLTKLRNLATRSSGSPAAQPTGAQPDVVQASADEVLADAEARLAAGQPGDAVDTLAAYVEGHRDGPLEGALVELRHRAAIAAAEAPGREPWPPGYADPFPDIVGRPPEISRSELTGELMGGAIAHHGCLLVRGLFDADQVARTRETIDRAHAGARELAEGRDGGRWYRPIPGDHGDEVRMQRPWVAARGGTWMGDSPAGMIDIVSDLRRSGAVDAITGHFGERPAVSLQKSTLRRTPPEYKLVSWHQDGDFLAPGVRSINVWVALDACSGDGPRPALEIVPRRIGEVLPAEGTIVPHSVDFDLVDEVAADTPTMCPSVEAGDAMLFDELFLHRTHLTPEMTEDRMALECWFFAPSHFSTNYVPLLV